MTPKLRIVHRRSWRTLALLLPLGFLAAVFNIPDRIADPGFSRHAFLALPILVRSGGTDQFPAQLRKGDPPESRFQVELTVKEPLTVPLALAYLTTGPAREVEDGILLGSLGSTGTYGFYIHLPEGLPDTLYLHLYNPVKKEVFQLLKL